MESHLGLSPHIECANSLWSIQLVPRNRHKINIGFLNIKWYFTHGLGGVRMEENLVFSANLRDFLNWLHHTNLVVDVNNRTSKGVGSDCRSQLIEINETILLDLEIGDIKTLVFQVTARVKHTFVLNLRSDKMLLFASVK